MSSLIAIDPNGEIMIVPNSYEGIKYGLHGATIAFVRAHQMVGFWIDDEGMLNGSPLNVPVSMYIGRPVWGPAVLCHGEPDSEGDTLPAEEQVVLAVQHLTDQWLSAVRGAERLGQNIVGLVADSATIPPPEIIQFESEEEFMRFLGGERE